MANKSSLGEKIRKIREAEGISRQRLSEMLDVPYSSLNNYETKNIQVTENIMIKITNHPTFQKYTLWLMNGLTAPESGQIAPALSLSGSDGLEVGRPTEKMVVGSDMRSSRSVRKTG